MTFPRELLEVLDGNPEWGFAPGLIDPAPRLELELVDGSRNARRFYALSIRPDPQQLLAFAGEGVRAPATLLIVERGRIGRTAKVDVRSYTSPEQLAAKWRELLGARRAHRYQVTRRL